MSENALLIVLSIIAALLVALLSKALREEWRRWKRASDRAGATRDEPGAGPASPAATQASSSQPKLPKVMVDEDDEELELTRFRVVSEDDGDEPTTLETVVPIVYDDEAAVDEPTHPSAFILLSAVGRTDRGKRRRRNEDSYLVLEDPPVFMVADGMGGYAGGDVASSLAVGEVERRFTERDFEPQGFFRGLPHRGAELVQAIQAANRRIFDKAVENKDLAEMGTTVVAARFSLNKQRVYVGHVGDSRCYVLRDSRLLQVTTDHTAGEAGVKGPLAHTLTRALGIDRKVVVDLILGKPQGGDRYLLCSDGLSKMLDDDEIADTLNDHDDPEQAVAALVDAANAHGGKDNITVIVIQVVALPDAMASA